MMADRAIQIGIDGWSHPEHAGRRPAVLCDAGLVTLGSLLVYILLSQDAFYRFDGWSLMGISTRGGPAEFVHYLSLPMFAAARSVGGVFGLPTFESLSILSALSAAFAVGIHHVALRVMSMSRAAALASSMLLATCIPVLFFATLIEHHALFLLFAACAFCASAWLVARPHWHKAVVLGVLMAVAQGVHASGLLLPLVLLPWYVVTVLGRVNRATMITMVVVAGLAMAVAIPALGALVYALGGAEAPLAVPNEYNFGRDFHWSYLPVVLWRELIAPYFPLSAVMIAGLFSKTYRLPSSVLLLSAGPYALAILRIIPNLDEHGAYVLPIALIAAPLTVRICGSRPALVLSLVSLLLGMLQISEHEKVRGTDAQYAADALAVIEHPAYVLVEALREMDSLVRYGLADGVTPLHLPNNIYQTAEEQQAFLPAIPFILGSRALYLSRDAEEWLAATESPVGAGVLLMWLRETYLWEAVDHGEFQASRLRAR